MNTIRFLWKYLGNGKKYFWISTIIQLVSVAIAVVVPIMSANLIVEYSDGYSSGIFLPIFLIVFEILLLRLINALFQYFVNLSFAKMEQILCDNINRELNGKSSGLNKSFMSDEKKKSVIATATEDVKSLSNGFCDAAASFGDIVFYIATMTVILIYSPEAFVASLVMLIIIFFIEKKKIPALSELDAKFRTKKDEYISVIKESVDGIDDIRLLNIAEEYKNKMDEISEKQNKSYRKMKNSNALYLLYEQNSVIIFCFCIMIIIGLFVVRQSITPVQSIVLINYLQNIGLPMIMVFSVFGNALQTTIVSEKRISALLEKAENESIFSGKKTSERLSGTLSVEGLTYSYRNNPDGSPKSIIDNVSFDFEPGKIYAIAGASGSGKTTFINLLAGIMNNYGGSVKIGENEIGRTETGALRNTVSMMPKSSYLFNMSIRDNFLMVDPNADDEKILSVCRSINVEKNILGKKDGLSTILYQDRNEFSSGQLQKIKIARLLLKDTPIMLMDESLSAQDTIFSQQIMDTLNSIKNDKIIIIAGHNCKVMENADSVLFFIAGKLVASGSHTELEKNCEEYAKLIDSYYLNDDGITAGEE